MIIVNKTLIVLVKEKPKPVKAWWFCGAFLRSAFILGFLCSAGIKFENVFLKLFQSIM